MSDQITCSNCRLSLDPSLVVCPHCGQARWGMIFATHLLWLISAGIFFFLAPRISSSFFRIIVQLITGLFSFIMLLAAIDLTKSGLRSKKHAVLPQKPVMQNKIPSIIPNVRQMEQEIKEHRFTYSQLDIEHLRFLTPHINQTIQYLIDNDINVRKGTVDVLFQVGSPELREIIVRVLGAIGSEDTLLALSLFAENDPFDKFDEHVANSDPWLDREDRVRYYSSYPIREIAAAEVTKIRQKIGRSA